MTEEKPPVSDNANDRWDFVFYGQSCGKVHISVTAKTKEQAKKRALIAFYAQAKGKKECSH